MKLGILLRVTEINACEEKFKQLSEMGFAACQLVFKPAVYTKEDAQRIRLAADQYGVEITAQFCGYHDEDTVWDNYHGFYTSGLNVPIHRESRLNYLYQAADFVSWLGITDMVIHAGFVPNNPFAPEYGLLKTTLHLLATHCQKRGVNVLLETGGESPVTLLRLIRELGHDNVFINLDPANILMYGYGNPVDAVYTFGQYVRNMHGKDGMPPTDPYKLGDEKPVGEGMVDFKTLLCNLRKIGYDRYIIIEREITGDQQIQDILKAKAYFESLLSAMD